jgi:hypothetical protein
LNGIPHLPGKLPRHSRETAGEGIVAELLLQSLQGASERPLQVIEDFGDLAPDTAEKAPTAFHSGLTEARPLCVVDMVMVEVILRRRRSAHLLLGVPR